MRGPRLRVSAGAVLLLAGLYFFLPPALFLALLLAAAAHELGHVLALRLTGQRVTGLFADAGGATIARRGDAAPAEEALCAVAGPAAGIAYALLAAAAGRALGWGLLTLSAGVSVVLSAFNMLPALPLDGGRVLAAALGARAAARVGLAVAVLTLLGGLWLVAQGLGAALFVAGAWLLLAQAGL